MIPISLKPKRFPAALGNKRGGNSRVLNCSAVFRPSVSVKTTPKMAPFSTLGFKNAPGYAMPKTENGQYASAVKFSTVTEPAVSFDAEIFDRRVNIEKKRSSSPAPKVPSNVAAPVTAPTAVDRASLELKLHGPRTEAWFTGKVPLHGRCPGVEADGRIYSLPQMAFQSSLPDSASIPEKAAHMRSALQEYFDNTWALTEVLLSSLQGEETFMRPPYHDLRHPMIFYYGHPAALYVNKLRVAGLLDKPINAHFEVIFETGVDEMSWDDLSKNQMAWPSVAEVHHYRKQVYDTVTALIAKLPDKDVLSINQSSPLWALVLAFEHERIHLETSSFLISELPIECVRFPEGLPAYHATAPLRKVDGEDNAAVTGVKAPVSGVHYPENKMVSVAQTEITIGKPRDFPTFGWDNEYGQRSFTVPAFKASEYKITNGEFLEFMQDGGYARNELWTAVGWEWRAFRNVKMPTHFVRDGPQGAHEYVLRLLFDQTTAVPWDWPVVVNLHEATAFAKWKSLKTGKPYRVLTELEHRAIRGSEHGEQSRPTLSGDPVTAIGGNRMMQQAGYNTNLACSSMSPVNALAPNAKGFYDVFGNAWEWTQDYFCALPGFQVHPNYEDFSTPCFDGLHHVIQGGSFISTGNECSVHSRFHFRPHFYQHASFRVVEMESPDDVVLTSDTDAPGPYVGSYPFRRSAKSAQEETARVLSDNLQRQRNDLLLKHFASSPLLPGSESVMAAFAKRIVEQARASNLDLQKVRAIEVGSGPGGLTFSLAAHCGPAASVIGVDHSAHAIDVARRVQKGEAVQAVLAGDGAATSTVNITSTNSKALVAFRNADPMCLPAEMGGFDLAVLHDVIDTLASPNALLGRLGGVRGLVRSKGLLVVSSAYQWKEERTPKDLWLGGGAVKAEDALVERLGEEFTHLRTEPMLQVWPESQRQLRGVTYSVSYFLRK